MIRVLIVDDNDAMRHAVGLLLGFEPDVTVVGDAPNGLAGLRLARELRPDVMVLDLRMPGMDGFAVLTELSRSLPDVRAVVLSGDVGLHSAALRFGAAAFVAKGCAGKELLGAVRRAATTSARVSREVGAASPLPRAI